MHFESMMPRERRQTQKATHFIMLLIYRLVSRIGLSMQSKDGLAVARRQSLWEERMGSGR